MERLFLTVLRMSATGALVILFVLLARLLLRKAPRIFSYALWAVALFRLLCPVTVSSAFSALSARDGQVACAQHIVWAMGLQKAENFTDVRLLEAGTLDPGRLTGAAAVVADALREGEETTGAGGLSMAAAVLQSQAGAVMAWTDPGVWVAQAAAMPDWTANLWLAGTAAMLAWSAISLFRLRRRLVGSVPLAGEKNVWRADHIPSPFVLGVFRPKIYLPSGLPVEEWDYILLHERTHIRRGDHVTRALAWLALAVHWFNPLVWLAFHLAGKDMEMSCDEAVLRKMGRDVRADYSSSLLSLSTGGRLPAGPLAFGEVDPKSRIKNVLRYKKPALWVTAAALILVLGVGVALATDPGGPIDPSSVISVTAFNATSSTATTDRGIVYAPDDRQKNLLDPADVRVVSREDGAELVRLINSHRKTVYGHGDLTLNGSEHHLTRIDCADGSFYLLDYWYWNGFSFNPLHGGEDDYTSLLTYYDAAGNAGTTWRLEYYFDWAYIAWREKAMPFTPQGGTNAGVEDIAADLSLTLGTWGDGIDVDIAGTVGGVELTRGASWIPRGEWGNAWGKKHPYGELSLVYPPFTDSIEGQVIAWWADEGRTSVTVSTKMQAMLSSEFNTGWWEFTVYLDSGIVADMTAHPAREGGVTGVTESTRMYPKFISRDEAVQTARIAAKLLTAAEDFYDEVLWAWPQKQPEPQFSDGSTLITGLDASYVEWHEPDRYGHPSWLYLADPAFLSPRLAGKRSEGSVQWGDGGPNSIHVLLNIDDERVASGTVEGFRAEFTVELAGGGAVLLRDFQSYVEGETWELSDREMLSMALTAANVLALADGHFRENPLPSQEEQAEPFSWDEVAARWEDGPGVKRDGFVLTEEADRFDPVERAKAEVTVDYNIVLLGWDAQAGMWQADFLQYFEVDGSDTVRVGGGQTVYLDSKGVTRLVVYGE